MHISVARNSVIDENLVYLSYHNIDIAYACQLATLLLRYYRNVWLDRFALAPGEDWQAGILAARARATGAIVIVSDDYLQSPYCRVEFEQLQNRGLAITAVIPRDFSTQRIGDFSFNDWIDFRRWFEKPDELSVENLLSQIPQSPALPKTGERLAYLRHFIQETELVLAKMPTAWAALRNSEPPTKCDLRPRLYHTGLLRDWAFSASKAGNSLPVEDLLLWAESEPQFVLQGPAGSGKRFFARLLALTQAHRALHEADAALPIWLDLSHFDQSQTKLDSFIEAQWPLLSYWRHWTENQSVFFVLDNWAAGCAANPTLAHELKNWIDSSPNHRFCILSRGQSAIELNLPRLQNPRLTLPLAQKFAAGYLNLEQQSSLRQLLRQKAARLQNSQLDYLSLGLELLAAERALAVNQWQKNPLPALLALRLQLLPSAAARGISAAQVLSALARLAWSMQLTDGQRSLSRQRAERQGVDARAIDCALAIGLLCAQGEQLRFEAEIFQQYLAAETLKKDGLIKYLTRPEFTAQGRRPRKWDSPARMLVDSLPEEKRLRLIDQIADIDPFLAASCWQRQAPLFDSYQETLIEKLTQLCAQNPSAQPAFRRLIRALPAPDRSAAALVAQLSRLNNRLQLWLWHEVRALPLALPLPFIEVVGMLDRQAAKTAAEQLADYPLALAVAWLVKLSTHEDRPLRRNAIWLLGELKYLPTAILLLDYLEKERGSDLDEVVLALMKYAYSEILARLLRWAQDRPEHRPAVIAALSARKRLVTSRLLALAAARQLTLKPEFYAIVTDMNEVDIGLGLAQLAAQHIELPQALKRALARKTNAADLQARIADAIEQPPNREAFARLLNDVKQVLRDPPESTIIAGSNLEALLYGQPLFDQENSQAAPAAPPASAPPPLNGGPPKPEPIAAPASTKPPSNDAEPAPADRGASTVIPPSAPAYSDAEKIKRTLAVLRADDWGRTQKAAQFLRKFAKHLRGRDNLYIMRLLGEALSDEDWSVRWAVAEALAALGNRAAIPQLENCLADSSWIVQVAGIRALVELDARDALPKLLPLLQKPQTALREAAAEACGALGDAQAIAALSQVLQRDADDFVRFAALKSICQLDAAQARPWLELALSDGYLDLRLYALRQLAPQLGESDLPILKQLLQDASKPTWEKESPRDLAIQALRRINSPRSRALLAAQEIAEEPAGA